ncbi:MAG: peptidoglycan binding protein CsiV [Gammaproteobacteria bacterium]|nr:peptidoglycan binding protein CsiV [Gammaproteobacteria bacterium]
MRWQSKTLLNSFFLFSLVSPAWVLAESEAKWYQVEVLIFANKEAQALQSERWPQSPQFPHKKALHELVDPPEFELEEISAGDVETITTDENHTELVLSKLKAEDLTFSEITQRFQQNETFEVLVHTGWRQSLIPNDRLAPVFINEAELGIKPTILIEDIVLQEQEQISSLEAEQALFGDGNLSIENTTAANDLTSTSVETEANSHTSELIDADASALIAGQIYNMGPPFNRVYGAVTLRRGRYLHLSVDLIYRAQEKQVLPPMETEVDKPPSEQELFPMQNLNSDNQPTEDEVAIVYLNTDPTTIAGFRLKESRRVRLNKLYYFDHPLFGFITRVTEYIPPEPEPIEAIETPLIEDPNGGSIGGGIGS